MQDSQRILADVSAPPMASFTPLGKERWHMERVTAT